jgi:hypothetical protein
MAADQHGDADRDRQIGLAGARRPDAEGQLIGEQVGDIVLLRLGPRLDGFLAGAQLDRAGLNISSCSALGLGPFGDRATPMRSAASTSAISTGRPCSSRA